MNDITLNSSTPDFILIRAMHRRYGATKKNKSSASAEIGDWVELQ